MISLPKQVPHARSEGKRCSQEACLKGRYFWKHRRHDSLRKAIQCFESAIRQDPQFALPYSGLADLADSPFFLRDCSSAQGHAGCAASSAKAIQLDPNLAEAHVSLADVLLHFDRDWQGADCEYRRAIQCNPELCPGLPLVFQPAWR